LLLLLLCALPALAQQMTPAGESQALLLDVPSAGDYTLLVTYRCEQSNAFTNVASLVLGDHTVRVPLPMLWIDEPGEVRTDRYGNEIAPNQLLKATENTVPVRDHTRYTGQPVVFTLEAGMHTVTFTPENADIAFISVVAIPAAALPTYEDYAAQYADASEGQDFLTLEAEDYAYKNDSYIRGSSSPNTQTIPFDATHKRINIIEDKSFNVVGQTLYYEFDIATSGFYTLTFKYCQPLKAGMSVFRTVSIDGEIPFVQAQDIAFPHTGMHKFDNLSLPGQVYLAQGRHTLGIAVTAAPLDQMYADITRIISEMNAVTLQIKKLTGQNSDVTANVDTNRTWRIEEYLPNLMPDVARWQSELTAIQDELRAISGQEPTFSNDLSLAVRNLEEFVKEPSKIPNKISVLADDANSSAQLLGTLLPKLSEQNMALDRLYIAPSAQALPDPAERLADSLAADAEQFAHSFSPIMNETVSRQNAGGRLTVWVNKSSQYVEVMRDLCAQTFTEETGIEVTFSIINKEDKIILANASGTNPDVAIGLSYFHPYNFAVRGIAKNLLEYEDFWEFYTSQYTKESLVPTAYDGGLYAACDSMDFQVLFYRKDILDMLGLAVPQTMNDVRAMMPTLHRNAMNFATMLSTDKEGYKSFNQTVSFIYQNGGDYYSEDGFTGGISNPNTVKGLREMCDLYRVSGLMQNVKSFFNSFRSGSIPLGISNFGTYVQLSINAPEMTGLWDIALAPGVMNEEGEILRYQSANSTAAMIFENTAMPDESYQFLRWWLEAETQTRYANELQRKYGPNYMWNTANLIAFENMPYQQSHKDVILTMWRDWQKEAPRHVASYMIEREFSFIWQDVVRDSEPFQIIVDAAQVDINREMERKLTEFGYLGENGEVLRPYIVDTVKWLEEAGL
jgi:ABC-type glycerol-3-phosphate transport system substrate-binding protein